MTKRIIKAITIVTTIVLTAILACSCGSKNVKIQDFVEVEFSPAYNGYAEPELIVDEDGLNAILDSKKAIKYIKSVLESNEMYSQYGDKTDSLDEMFESDPDLLPKFTNFFCFDFAESYRGLENGDKVKVEIKLDSGFMEVSGIEDESVKDVAKKLGLKLSKTELEFKAKGLEDLKTIKVDLNKLLKVDFGKYQGYASPSVEVDYEYLDSILIDEVVESFAESCESKAPGYFPRDCEKWFTAEFDKAYSGLKNGDLIKVNIVPLGEYFINAGISIADFETGLALDLNGGVNIYSVGGLVEPKNVVDIFEGIEQYIAYEGANGNGMVNRHYQFNIPDDYSKQIDNLYFTKGGYTNSVKIVHENTKIGEISYHIKGEKLGKGDVLEITTSCPVDELEALGYIVPTTHKNTTVPDLGEYMREKSQLTPDVLSAIKDKFYSEAGIEGLEKLYLATYKPGVECSYDSTSFIVGVYYKKGFWSSGYYIDDAYDIIIKPDNSIVVEYYDKANSWNSYDTLEEAVGAFADEYYDFTELE